MDHIGKTSTFLILWLILLHFYQNDPIFIINNIKIIQYHHIIIPSFSKALYVFWPTDLELITYYYYTWQKERPYFIFLLLLLVYIHILNKKNLDYLFIYYLKLSCLANQKLVADIHPFYYIWSALWYSFKPYRIPLCPANSTYIY